MRRLLHVGAGPPRAVLLLLAGLSVAVAAGCGGAIPSSNGGPASVKLQSSKLGRFLVDAQGHTLYLFERDEEGESYCTGACASVWPPFETESKPTGVGGVAASALGTIKRDDGDVQVTYRGHPLYFYSADASNPGNVKGEDVSQFGSSWYVLGANGKPVEPDSSSGSEGNSGSNNNGSGGGYG
jgi:predicted lipoprotein with Yx(FWY)xxD motif